MSALIIDEHSLFWHTSGVFAPGNSRISYGQVWSLHLLTNTDGRFRIF